MTSDSVKKSGRAHKWVAELTAERITAGGTILVAMGTIAAVWIASDQIGDAVKARRAQNYLELRKAFFNIEMALDGMDRSAPHPLNDKCPTWNALKRYWYFSQTEWTLKQIDNSEKDDWEENTRSLLVGALRQPSFRKSFLDIATTRFVHYKNGRLFYCELANAYNPKPGSELSYSAKDLAKELTAHCPLYNASGIQVGDASTDNAVRTSPLPDCKSKEK